MRENVSLSETFRFAGFSPVSELDHPALPSLPPSGFTPCCIYSAMEVGRTKWRKKKRHALVKRGERSSGWLRLLKAAAMNQAVKTLKKGLLYCVSDQNTSPRFHSSNWKLWAFEGKNKKQKSYSSHVSFKNWWRHSSLVTPICAS